MDPSLWLWVQSSFCCLSPLAHRTLSMVEPPGNSRIFSVPIKIKSLRFLVKRMMPSRALKNNTIQKAKYSFLSPRLVALHQ